MNAKIKQKLPELKRVSDDSDDNVHTSVDSFYWEGFTVSVTSIYKVTHESRATYWEPAEYEISDSGVIKLIELDPESEEAVINLVLCGQETQLQNVLEDLFPYCDMPPETELKIKGAD